jgi:hypothetical protein
MIDWDRKQMSKLRVIQWTTGKVGKMALRGIFNDPRLELVGVYAHGADKRGVDAGAICGRPHCGVLATDSVDELLALKADSVIYAPFRADLSHLVRLLESGVDVVSTSLLNDIGGVEGATGREIAAACLRGNSSLYITGINPGWLDTVAAVATPICSSIDSISLTESVSVAHYESVETWLAHGFSLKGTTPEIIENSRPGFVSFSDSVIRLANALEYRLDRLEFSMEFATAAKTVDLGWFRMEQGTNAAVRAGWNGIADGKTVISNRVIWYMTKDLEQGWDIDEDNYFVDIAGEPNVNLRVRVTPPDHWGHLEHATCTAMPAVSVLLQVKAAPAGILGLTGAGLPRAPAGLWRKT